MKESKSFVKLSRLAGVSEATAEAGTCWRNPELAEGSGKKQLAISNQQLAQLKPVLAAPQEAPDCRSYLTLATLAISHCGIRIDAQG